MVLLLPLTLVSRLRSTPWTVRLPNGHTVELVKVERVEGGRSQAWKPDGTPSPDPLRGEGTDIFARIFQSRLRLGLFVHVDLARDGDQGFLAPNSFGYGILDSNAPGVTLHPVFRLPSAGVRSADFRIGVASGGWSPCLRSVAYRRLRSVAYGRSPQSTASYPEIEVSQPGDGLTFQYRAVAVDDKGTRVPLREAGSMKLKGRTTLFFSLERTQVAPIVRVELQRRPYQWAIFRNVPLTPR